MIRRSQPPKVRLGLIRLGLIKLGFGSIQLGLG